MQRFFRLVRCAVFAVIAATHPFKNATAISRPMLTECTHYAEMGCVQAENLLAFAHRARPLIIFAQCRNLL